MKRLVLAALFLEVGVVLVVVPWSSYWDRNYFAETLPQLRAFVTNNFVRGAVSGLGLVNVVVAVTEVTAVLFARRPSTPVSVLRSSAPEDA